MVKEINVQEKHTIKSLCKYLLPLKKDFSSRLDLGPFQRISFSKPAPEFWIIDFFPFASQEATSLADSKKHSI